MIVDDSFNYHSLSLTIMFAIKRSMIVHDSLSKSRNVLASPRAIVNKYGGALNFVTKMAVYQPRGAAIATILVTVMQDDICEELLGRHKRGRTKEWIRRRDEKGMYRCISNYHSTSRCLFFLYIFFAFLTFALSASLSSQYSFKLLLCCSSQNDGNAVAIWIALSPPWLPPLTEKLSCTIIRSVKREKLS